MGAMTITQAEKAWRTAWDAMDKSTMADDVTAIRLMRAEQDAWDAYTDLCNEINQCYQPGCRATTPGYCYCPRHRPS